MASPLEVTQLVGAPRDVVWADLSQLDRHVEWMHDAAKITFRTEQRSGVGTAFDCLTVVGPLRTVDRMEITSWIEGHEIGVRHTGLVTGEGVIRLRDAGPLHSIVSWTERLEFPLYFGGPLGAAVAKPVMRLIWRSSLRGFARRFDDA